MFRSFQKILSSQSSLMAAAFVWLLALLAAIFPELVINSVIMPLDGKMHEWFFDARNRVENDKDIPALTVFSFEFIERSSFFFIPFAVVIDTAVTWIVLSTLNLGEFKKWLPLCLIRSQKPRLAFIFFLIAAVFLVLGIWSGLLAYRSLGSVAGSPPDGAVLCIVFILLFAFFAKYFSLVVLVHYPDGTKQNKFFQPDAA